MICYKGDTIAKLVYNSEHRGWIETDIKPFDATMSVGRTRVNIKDGCYPVGDRGLSLHSVPIELVERAELLALFYRPWYNHLRAFMDSILHP